MTKSSVFKFVGALKTALGRNGDAAVSDQAVTFDPLSVILGLLSEGDWRLSAAGDLQLMAPALRATYAYAFGIEVQELSFVSLSAQVLTVPLPDFIRQEAADRICLRLAYVIAEEYGAGGLAGCFPSSKTEVVDAGAETVLDAVFDEPRFSASVEFLLTEAHGPLGSAAAKIVAGAMREHAYRAQLGTEPVQPIRNLLESFRYALPLTRHHAKPGTLVLLSA